MKKDANCKIECNRLDHEDENLIIQKLNDFKENKHTDYFDVLSEEYLGHDNYMGSVTKYIVQKDNIKYEIYLETDQFSDPEPIITSIKMIDI